MVAINLKKPRLSRGFFIYLHMCKSFCCTASSFSCLATKYIHKIIEQRNVNQEQHNDTKWIQDSVAVYQIVENVIGRAVACH